MFNIRRALLPIFLLLLVIVLPVFALTYAGHERVIRPGLSTPPGVDLAEALFIFEQILLERGFYLKGHSYFGLQDSAMLMLKLGREQMRVDIPSGSSACYIFQFEAALSPVGEMVLIYDLQSETLRLEAVRFEEKEYRGSDTNYFNRVTDNLMAGVVREIKGRLR